MNKALSDGWAVLLVGDLTVLIGANLTKHEAERLASHWEHECELDAIFITVPPAAVNEIVVSTEPMAMLPSCLKLPLDD